MPMLMRREAENCFFIGHIPSLANPSNEHLWLVRDRGEPVAVALMTPGRHMVMTDVPDEAAEALASHIIEENVDVPGVQGAPRAAEAFARRWAKITGATGTPIARMACHQLTQLTLPQPAPGSMRVATDDDIPLVGRWVDGFFADIHESTARDGPEIAKERIAKGCVHLWEDHGEPVSMAAYAGRTPNGIRINLVYTPAHHRGRGYASNNVAALTRKLLDEGRRFCFLYTDLANPTSNKIYYALGYRPVCENLRIDFTPRAT
jgi:predicted GNAT family acetyltransferase